MSNLAIDLDQFIHNKIETAPPFDPNTTRTFGQIRSIINKENTRSFSSSTLTGRLADVAPSKSALSLLTQPLIPVPLLKVSAVDHCRARSFFDRLDALGGNQLFATDELVASEATIIQMEQLYFNHNLENNSDLQDTMRLVTEYLATKGYSMAFDWSSLTHDCFIGLKNLFLGCLCTDDSTGFIEMLNEHYEDEDEHEDYSYFRHINLYEISPENEDDWVFEWVLSGEDCFIANFANNVDLGELEGDLKSVVDRVGIETLVSFYWNSKQPKNHEFKKLIKNHEILCEYCEENVIDTCGYAQASHTIYTLRDIEIVTKYSLLYADFVSCVNPYEIHEESIIFIHELVEHYQRY